MFEPLEVEQDDKYKRFGKRSFVFVCMLLLLFFVLAARLFALQILNSETYASISSRNQLRIVVIHAFGQNLLHRPCQLLCLLRRCLLHFF